MMLTTLFDSLDTASYCCLSYSLNRPNWLFENSRAEINKQANIHSYNLLLSLIASLSVPQPQLFPSLLPLLGYLRSYLHPAMEVHLLVYDLSQGLASQMSMGMLGFQLDAVYHTSIELDGLEYVYDGNVVAITPGSSHLGQPVRRLHLGKTNLPIDAIQQYLESLREIYTVEVRPYCLADPICLSG